ncbi:hypothetical protein BTVI_100787 [Pitangus sulphuratus]|nr:hypothetical protein BTVI_100787 [Pitangus sulphuratus]
MVRLVVIDSIAALFRCEFGVSESVMKARYLQTFGAQLHSLSTRFRTPIMCINQVTDAVSELEAAQCSCRKGREKWMVKYVNNSMTSFSLVYIVEDVFTLGYSACERSVLEESEAVGRWRLHSEVGGGNPHVGGDLMSHFILIAY